MNSRRIEPTLAALKARLRAVPSKSATHRALLTAALADGPSQIHNPLVADDTLTTRRALQELGVRVSGAEDVSDAVWEVLGSPGPLPGGGQIELLESGTSFRFLAALAALGSVPSTLDGSPRLRQRPIDDLTDALRDLGAQVGAPPAGASLPLTLGGRTLTGGSARIPGDRSSQFASALLLIGSRLPRGLDLELVPPVVSSPYIQMTVDMLQAFGVPVARLGEQRLHISPCRYPGRSFRVEGDHSSASYFLAAPALVGGVVRLDDLHPDSVQPDACLGPILSQLGCTVRSGDSWIEVEGNGRLEPFDLDMNAAPDVVPTLAVLALASDGPCTLRGIAHLRLKESDRLEALATNLSALGRRATVVDDRLEIDGPGDALGAATIRTFSDHRMAMAFALAGLRVPGITLDDADCVAKSNPGFWGQFETLTKSA